MKTLDNNLLLVLAMALLVSCWSCSRPTVTVDQGEDAKPSAELANVTIYVAGMNQKLQILWGDWPNTVKQALVELNGVESVEDEWERELESDEDLDLLFVTYDRQRVTVAQILETIRKHQFEAHVKDES